MVKKRQTLRLALCSRRNLSVVVLGVVTLFALRHDGGLEKLFSFGSSKNDISGVKDTRQLAATADYVNKDLPEVSPKKQYHVILPCDGRIYHEWQARVFYFWYLRIKGKKPKNMGGFTRILHSGEPDDWMHEIPTVIVKPLPADLEKIADGYVMLNRPYAILQWVKEYMPSIKEHFVLLAEPDHLLIRAPPLWATYNRPSAYPFFYIKPSEEKNAKIIQKYNPKDVPLKQFFPVGPSPLMISKKQLGPISSKWFNISFALKQDKEAFELWGWTSEMYAFSIAAAVTPEGPKAFNLRPEFMAQPPWDKELNGKNGRRAALIHYTYSNDFDPEGTFTPAVIGKWHFDKRDYIDHYPLNRTKRPPPGCDNSATRLFIKCINIAARSLEGWQDRAYKSASEIVRYFGYEGDVLDIDDPEMKTSSTDVDDYTDDVDLEEIDEATEEDYDE
ncbi:Hydroxyproline O-arabinosyltransferase PLENTY [Picochlorum sp. SENEW3]|nr:Hydroxyproline O-arabinosyltransferase PLENTY [Picochlorum sp. SENEW3]